MLLKKLGWWDELTDSREEGGRRQELEDRPLRRHPARGDEEPRLPPVRQRQGARGRLELPGRRSRSTASRSTAPRPDLVAKYPTHDDKKAFWRLPTLYKTVQEKNRGQVGRDLPADPHRPGAWSNTRAAARRRAPTRGSPSCSRRCFVEINPKAAADRGIRNGEHVWVKTRRPARQLKVKALVTERVGPDTRASSRSTSAGCWQGKDLLPYYPEGAAPVVRGEAVNTATTYGYDTRDDDAGNQDDALPTSRQRLTRRPTMARMKFICDAERCIECNGCVTACKNEHEVPWGVNRRRVVTLNDGVPGEKSISVACMHCSDAPCMAVCPVDCFYRTDDGVVLHDKDLCIGCGYCFYACPFGAPQFPQAGAFGLRGKMDKCTFCAGGPEANRSEAEFQQVRPQPPRRGQASGVRRDVLDQGAARAATAT